jgi:hypothetical protein
MTVFIESPITVQVKAGFVQDNIKYLTFDELVDKVVSAFQQDGEYEFQSYEAHFYEKVQDWKLYIHAYVPTQYTAIGFIKKGTGKYITIDCSGSLIYLHQRNHRFSDLSELPPDAVVNIPLDHYKACIGE